MTTHDDSTGTVFGREPSRPRPGQDETDETASARQIPRNAVLIVLARS